MPPPTEKRLQAVRNHHKWIDIAAILGCHSVRCNTHGDDSDPDAMLERAAASYAALCEYGAAAGGINVLLENHSAGGHYGCFAEPAWMVRLFQAVDKPNFGSLPDFGNFPPETRSRTTPSTLMPYAKAVSPSATTSTSRQRDQD